jgi:aminopeptidase N
VSTYLTSVVIGNFLHDGKNYNGTPVSYYWPKDIEDHYDPMLTFADTPNIMRIFKEYFGVDYPFEKYSQVAVDNFDFGGMENASCTTLTRSILHDKRASLDYTFDLFDVSHELSHQWFGDLVTCKEWSHIWLNEGFATFCEALSWEKYWQGKNINKKDDEYNYKILQTADRYFSEASSKYKRAIVTNIYKYPEELFDDHSYRKGGCVLHMLRYYIGDDAFKNALRLYLERYSYKSAETDDLRKAIEEVSRISLQPFFNQWLYRAGHPELEIEYSLEENETDPTKLQFKMKIIQAQDDDVAFEFPLEVRLVFSSDNNDKKPEIIDIVQKITEYSYDEIPKDVQIKWISIDPDFKVLKEIRSIKIVEEKPNFKSRDLLTNQLKYGKTVLERIQAARILRDKKYSEDDEVIRILREVISEDDFYGASAESAKTLGSYSDKSDYNKSNKAYISLKKCLDNETFSRILPQVKRAVVTNIGTFEMHDPLDRLVEVLQDDSYFVQYEAALAIGKCSKNLPTSTKPKKIDTIDKLRNLVDNTKTFQNLLAQGALNGLKEFAKDNDEHIVDEIASFLVEKSKKDNDFYIRYTAAAALGKFLVTKNEETNQKAYNALIELLRDKRQRVKQNACTALADPDAKPSSPNPRIMGSISELTDIAGHDLDGFVRRVAEDSLNIIREWIKEWADKPQKIDVKMRKQAEEKEMPIGKKQDYEKRIEAIRRPVIEY